MSFLNTFFLTSVSTFNHIFSALFSRCYLVTWQTCPSLWNHPVSITIAPEGRRRGYRDTGRPTQRARFSKHLPLAGQLPVQTNTCWGFVLIQLSGEGLSLLPLGSGWISSTRHFVSVTRVVSLPKSSAGPSRSAMSHTEPVLRSCLIQETHQTSVFQLFQIVGT